MHELMTGAIGGLVPKLRELLEQDRNLQTSLMEHMENIQKKLRIITTDPQDNRYCAQLLKKLLYDIEDIIDKIHNHYDYLLLQHKGSEPSTNHDSFVRDMLVDIKARARNLAWHVNHFVPTTDTIDLCLEDDGFVQVRQLVGVHKLRAELISRMSLSCQRLEIVSIRAPGGMGKTILAKAIYDNIKGEFDCSAFVSVGRQPDLNNVLTDILMHLDKKRYSDLNTTMLNEGQLIDELQHFLKNKRYLIVTDDIWDIPSWEVIKCALEDNGRGSRIITTSRVLGAAESSCEVLNLMPLSIDCSRELFYATLCGSEGTLNFDPIDDQTTEYILQKCGGVPLAIIMIASLLAGKPQEEWSEVYKSIRFGQEDNIGADENTTRKIIQFSYYDLPSHLQTCLSYLSKFPDGHVIERDKLVWRWVAEGFVHDEQQGKSLFKVGERYLYELISRNMIQAVENEDTNIRACRVEGMVLDWIRIVAKGGSNNRAKNHIAGLLHLRYLGDGLGGMGLRGLSIEIGVLSYLQILDLTDTYIGALPPSVTQLRLLKCLRCFASTKLKLPQGMGNLTSLEELRLGKVGDSPNFAKELRNLTELRVLCIFTQYILYGKWSKALVMSLSKLQKIEVLEVRMGEGILFDLINCFRRDRGSQEPWHPVIAPGTFPKLRYMKMNTLLMSQPGAMPRLKSVELHVHVRALKDANLDFHDFYKLNYLRLLEKVHVAIICRHAKMEEAEEAETALRHAFQSHPNRPNLILNRVGRCVNDKQICFLDGLHGSEVAPQVMPLELLREITNDFSDKQRLGSGTFGAVYKGVLDGKEVAVKLLHSMAQKLDYEEEFMMEFENLRSLNHPNIVQLLGYCYEIKRVCVEHGGRSILADKIYRVLCFDYMHNGSLQGHLDDEVNRMDWPTCYKIVKGTCEGLEYLHKGSESPMYHLDLKPGNILLDKNMLPKLADFGLSKLVFDNQTQATSSTWGTKRYCPPEYIDHGFVSNKFDIFSLGVVMIELIAGSEGYSKAYEMPSQEFIDHVQENWRKRLQATPGYTSPIYECRQVQRCIEIALDCVSADRKQRPNIGDITSWLDEIETEELATTFTSQNEI